MAEREIKLGAAPSFHLPTLRGIVDGVDADPSPTERISATYFDTDDLRLMRWGVSLRHRTNDGWTVKLPQESDGTMLVREEVVFAGGPGRPPAEAVDLVRAFVRTEGLRPKVRLRTERQQTKLHDGEGQLVAEVVDDDVAVLDGRRIMARFRELEVEVLDETRLEVLDALVARLQESGAGPPDPTPKVVRALGPLASAPAEISLEPLGAASTVGEVVRRAFAASVDRLVRHDPVVRLDADPEGVHQARVATRRLRSDLRTFRSLLEPGSTSSLRDELGWLAEKLGGVRDLDVLLARVRRRTGGLPEEDRQGASRLLTALEAGRAEAYAELMATLRGDRYLALLDSLIEMANALALLGDEDREAAAVLPALIAGPLKRLGRDIGALGDRPDDDDLHALRIQAKRARYAVEAVSPVLGKRARAAAEAAAVAQDILGEHSDAVVAERWLRGQARASRSPATAFVAGELAGLERAAATRARARWRKASKKLLAGQARALR
jgi:CHAD domain-containing protein